jgi:alkanesulfonate monooxygenase SsuD/methylene tetrahydromethanopterin reductase-like flavin-dependent oxidoreductase (luciferase family)
MRFSIFQLPSSAQPGDDVTVLNAVVEQALYADEAGFAGVFTAEHHTTGLSPQGSDSMMYATYLAPQLRQAHLGFALIVVPYHHPLLLAERMNLLDQLAKGRVLFGVGSGNRDMQECVSLGVDMDDAVSHLLEDNLQIMEKLWAKEPQGEPVAFDNGYYRGTLVERIVPASHGPRPKLMGVAMREQSIRRSAAGGWPVFVFGAGPDARRRLRLYREELAAAGHPAQVLEHCMAWTTHTFVHTVVADTDAKARELMVAKLAHEGRRRERTAPFLKKAMDIAGVTAPLRQTFGDLGDPDRPDYLYGSPDTVAARIQEYADLGIGNILLNFDGNMYTPERHKANEAALKLFAQEVLPRFIGVTTPADPLAVPLDEISPAVRN